MDWLNYHHLYYFWTVAREGSITAACRRLLLAQPTISMQLRQLETALGEPLFTRRGRRLELTETGRTAFRYADEIFGLGRELLDTLRDRPTGRPVRLTVGISDVVPKWIAYRLLEPALHLPQSARLTCREERPDRLWLALGEYELDMVLADAPLGGSVPLRVFNHLLGECGTSLLAAPSLAARLSRRFPDSMQQAPWLLPTREAAVRRSLDQWFDERGIRPHVVGDFEDSALIKAFGQAGVGVFPVPTAIEAYVCKQYHVRVVGRLPELRERFFAITLGRKLKNPAVLAVVEAARKGLFA